MYQDYNKLLNENEKGENWEEYIPPKGEENEFTDTSSGVPLEETKVNFCFEAYIIRYILNSIKISLSNCPITTNVRRIDVIPLPRCILQSLILIHNYKFFSQNNVNCNENESKNMNDQLIIKEYPSGNVRSEKLPLKFLWLLLNDGVEIQTDINNIVTTVESAEIVWKRYKHRFSLILTLDKMDKHTKLQE